MRNECEKHFIERIAVANERGSQAGPDGREIDRQVQRRQPAPDF
jgi:hypothetical protein